MEKLKPEIMHQNDFDTCLAMCLLMARSTFIPTGPNLEQTLYMNAFGEYAQSHFALKYAASYLRTFDDTTTVNIYVDHVFGTGLAKSLSDSVLPSDASRLFVTKQTITPQWIKEMLRKDIPVILLANTLQLNGLFNDTHYVIFYQTEDETFYYIDPMSGKQQMDQQRLLYTITGVANNIGWEPLALTVTQ